MVFFDPLYHEFICRNHKTRTMFTKIHDFVPFGIFQDPEKLILTLFQKILKILTLKFLGGPLGKNSKN